MKYAKEEASSTLEGKRLAACCLLVVMLLSTHQRPVAAMSKCNTECRESADTYPCNVSCIQDCIKRSAATVVADQLPREQHRAWRMELIGSSISPRLGVRKMFVDCCAVPVRSFGVRLDERDVSMIVVFKAEIAELLGPGFAGAALPRVFVDGQHHARAGLRRKACYSVPAAAVTSPREKIAAETVTTSFPKSRERAYLYAQSAGFSKSQKIGR
jgi:hypothetical protein